MKPSPPEHERAGPHRTAEPRRTIPSESPRVSRSEFSLEVHPPPHPPARTARENHVAEQRHRSLGSSADVRERPGGESMIAVTATAVGTARTILTSRASI
ncbi:hypothetical protein GS506_20155 [Rhodococcus hoagii]|nr:hypothetical protein [Prescottella equi]